LSQNDLFINLPVITYNGQTAIDISQSLKMVSNLVSNTQILTPYTMNQSIRSDQLSQAIYEDPYLEWMIFLANQQIDGFDWYMDQNQFYTYLNNKYGDWVLTQQQVSYYINNWYNGTNLTVSAFNALDPSLVKYYEPILDAALQPLGYSRRQIDWTISTNHLLQFSFANTVNIPTFTNNEVVTITWTTNDTANGQVCFQSNTQKLLNIQHVSGDYAFANTINAGDFSIVGSQSNATLTISNSNNVSRQIYNTVSLLEDVFYDPVTIFDDENQKNEARKYITFLPNNYISQAISEVQNIFS
jgi:Base plate wedge protein 53